MIDISDKDTSTRTATATGTITLKASTIQAIKERRIEKGPVLETARIGAMIAVKQTSLLQPHCHNIPISSVQAKFAIKKDRITAEVSVKTDYKTGVEMEAIIAVHNALATIWDMTKYLEKDKEGQYPKTMISDIKVTRKKKG